MGNTNTKSTILTRLNPYFKRSSILSDKQELLNCNKTQDFIRILEDHYTSIRASEEVIKLADKRCLDLKTEIQDLRQDNSCYNSRLIGVHQELNTYKSLVNTYKIINRTLCIITIIAILSSILDKLL